MTITASSHMAEAEATRINASLEAILELVKREADNLRFKHTRVDRQCGWNRDTFTVMGDCGLTLDLDANRSLPSGFKLMVGVFGVKQREKPMKLEDHAFAAKSTAQGTISWQDQNGTNCTPQQLCRFAFDRLREHTERCYRQAEF